jgi:hypothetical protein
MGPDRWMLVGRDVNGCWKADAPSETLGGSVADEGMLSSWRNKEGSCPLLGHQ